MLKSSLLKLITLNLNKFLLNFKYCTVLSYDSIYDPKVRKILKTKLDTVNNDLLVKIKSSQSYQSLSDLDWNLIKKNTIQENSRYYNVNNFEVQLMEHMIENKFEDKIIIQSFQKFIQQLFKVKKNRIISAHYCIFLAILNPESNLEEIKSTLDDLTADKTFCRYPVIWKAWATFAAISKDCCSHCLKSIRPYIDSIPIKDCSIVLSAFKFGFIKEGTQLASQLSSEFLKKDQNLIKEWINCLINQNEDKNDIYFIQFLKILQEKRFYLNNNLVDSLLNLLAKKNYQFVITNIKGQTGKCKNCGHQLETINQDEVNLIRQSVQKKLIYWDNEVFLNSTQAEVDKFNKFISEHASSPFNLVVDALNISFSGVRLTLNQDRVSKRLVPAPSQLQENLYLILEMNKIFEKFKKILIIGKKHMKNWASIQKLKNLHSNQVFIFLLNNESKDDQFILLAAVQSSQTYLLTSDYLRDHHALIKEKTLGLFEKWKYCRQIRLAPFSKKLEHPQNVDYIVQFSNEVIHFPINTNTSQDKDERFISKWICASPNK